MSTWLTAEGAKQAPADRIILALSASVRRGPGQWRFSRIWRLTFAGLSSLTAAWQHCHPALSTFCIILNHLQLSISIYLGQIIVERPEPTWERRPGRWRIWRCPHKPHPRAALYDWPEESWFSTNFSLRLSNIMCLGMSQLRSFEPREVTLLMTYW
jgi:hypothetical protein